MTAARVSLVLLLAVAACRSRTGTDDPTEGAIHMPIVGRTESFSRASDDDVPKIEDGRVSSYADEARYVQGLVRDVWIHHDLHRDADGVDLERVFGKLERTVADRETTRLQYTRALRRALCRLSDGNLELVPGTGSTRHASGLLVRGAEPRELVIAGVDEARYKGERKPAVGSTVTTIDGRALELALRDHCIVSGSSAQHRRTQLAEALGVQERLSDEKAVPAKIGLRTPEGAETTLALRWQATPAAPHTCILGATSSGPGVSVGTITVRDLGCAGTDEQDPGAGLRHQLDLAIEAVAGSPHVILDLRQTVGGSHEAALGLTSRFGAVGSEGLRVRERPPTPGERLTDGAAERGFESVVVPEPEGPRLEGKVWVLVGPGCAGACELVAAYASTRDDIVLLGQTTAGAGGEAHEFTLPFSELRIAVPNRTFAIPGSDTLIEGRGVSPAVEVPTTVEDLRTGRDPVLDAALQRITASP